MRWLKSSHSSPQELKMITTRPKYLNPDTSGSMPTDVLLRQEPEDDEEEEDKKNDDSEDENDSEEDDGYSE
jgi:hypothetical protein